MQCGSTMSCPFCSTSDSRPTVCLRYFMHEEGREKKLLHGWKRRSCCRQTHTVSDPQKLRELLLEDKVHTETPTQQLAAGRPLHHPIAWPYSKCASHDLSVLGKLSFPHHIISHTLLTHQKWVKPRKMLLQTNHRC